MRSFEKSCSTTCTRCGQCHGQCHGQCVMSSVTDRCVHGAGLGFLTVWVCVGNRASPPSHPAHPPLLGDWSTPHPHAFPPALPFQLSCVLWRDLAEPVVLAHTCGPGYLHKQCRTRLHVTPGRWWGVVTYPTTCRVCVLTPALCTPLALQEVPYQIVQSFRLLQEDPDTKVLRIDQDLIVPTRSHVKMLLGTLRGAWTGALTRAWTGAWTGVWGR